MNKVVIFSVILSAIIFSCQKEENEPELQSQTFEVNSTSSLNWKYFSFEINDTLTVTDPANSEDWDLAFQRYRIRTNGGYSGNGLGSAANTYLKGQTGFDDLKLVPDTLTFVNDDSVNIAVQQGYATYLINPVLYTWFTMEMAAQGTQIVPSDNIYIVRTGKGKYTKVWFKSYYSATNVSGYITFQYKYQQDGSKNLE